MSIISFKNGNKLLKYYLKDEWKAIDNIKK